ncbi:MAG: hypothetical protein ACXW27_13455 [Allosphingosinicella sp.]
MVHGALESHLARKSAEAGAEQAMPAGFYATRYVVAVDEVSAVPRALRSVRRAIERRYPALKTGLMSVSLTGEEVDRGRWIDLFRSINRGFNFYLKE